MESIKDSFGVYWIKTHPGVLYHDPDLIGFARLGANCQLSLTVVYDAHRFDSVQDQV